MSKPCRLRTVADAGCDTFIVHARKAWLQGLSPKENREIPPLNYPRVHRLKQARPELSISINGGVKTLEETQQQLELVDGVMVGREVYANPYIMATVDNAKTIPISNPGMQLGIFWVFIKGKRVDVFGVDT